MQKNQSHMDSLKALSEVPALFILRSHQPGDLGWIVHRHGALYHREHGYKEKFEAMVAEIAAQFLENYDPSYEHCWIAERRPPKVRLTSPITNSIPGVFKFAWETAYKWLL